MGTRSLWPVENVVYHTLLTAEQVIENLQNNIEAKKLVFLKTSYSKPYIGSIYGNSFQLERVISYRSSFLPQITGEIIENENKTIIKIKMKLDDMVLGVLILWLSSISLFFINMLYSLFIDGFDALIFLPIAMFWLAIGMYMLAFKSETETSKKDFARILEAEVLQI